ncbi:MAG: glycosyltransferase, partial [Spirochaetaceae bacterium]|nr:glycosyltransferase [Spirochaetaceae bacterium]
SETEGRGLPIIESGACGVPIICSRYEPEEVFAGVVGEHLPADEQINYIPFPEGEFTPDFLTGIAALLLDGVGREENQQHNRRAVGARYGREMLMRAFSKLIEAV